MVFGPVENPVDKVCITVENRGQAEWRTCGPELHRSFPQASIVLHPFSTTYQQSFPQAGKRDVSLKCP